ncbi:MAG: hypothetical protein ACFE8U_12055 [Candidatus Hermodarchaeota archaeon]
MAEMQRKREKKEKQAKSIKILSDVLNEVTKEKDVPKSPKISTEQISTPQTISSPSTIIPPNQIKSHISAESITQIEKPSSLELEPGKVDPRVKTILPGWVNKPWRWMVPDDPKLKQQWLITWGEFLLDFARVLNFHILDLQEVAIVYPFQNSLLKKKLNYPQLVMISEYLIEIEKAKWWDDERTRLRVYWKTLKSHADDLFEYAFQNGYEMVTAYDIVKMKQVWSSLPPSDIRMLMKLMVDSKRAFWADSDMKTIQFTFN